MLMTIIRSENRGRLPRLTNRPCLAALEKYRQGTQGMARIPKINCRTQLNVTPVPCRSEVQRAPIVKLIVLACLLGFGRVRQIALKGLALARHMIGGEHLAGDQVQRMPGRSLEVR